MSPAEILRNRARAVGCDMTVEQATGCYESMKAQGFKLVARDCGESKEVALEGGKLVTQEPSRIWALIWDQHA